MSRLKIIKSLTVYRPACRPSPPMQPLKSFIIKIIQLYEMIIVRHGLMLVGYSYGMKTSSYRCVLPHAAGLQNMGVCGCMERVWVWAMVGVRAQRGAGIEGLVFFSSVFIGYPHGMKASSYRCAGVWRIRCGEV